MPASVTIYNDSKVAADLQVTLVPGHSKAPIENTVAIAEGDQTDCHQFELEPHDILIIRRIS